MLSFDSGNNNRDSHTAEVVESYIYADVSFQGKATRLDSAATRPDSAATRPDGRARPVWQAAGTMTFHGVSRPLTCPVQLEVTPRDLSAHGKFAVKLTDFAIELPALLGLKVKDEVDLVFDVVGQATRPDSADAAGGAPGDGDLASPAPRP